MPYDYIIEMICDWWSFSWQSGNLYEIFKWYEEHSKYIKLAQTTKITVEYILDNMKKKLQAFTQSANDAINQAMILLLTLPLEVLMDHYWPKSYAKRIPEFTEHVLEYYEKWQNDELDMDKLKEDLWVYGGVRLEEVEGK